MDGSTTTNVADNANKAPTAEELIARARALSPKLLERAAATEDRRSLLDETVADVTAAGLDHVCKPAVYGGYEMGYDVLCEVVMELAKGCASTAWTFGVFAEHNNMVAAGFGKECQDELWAENPNALISSGSVTGTPESIAKTPTLTKTDGGYRLTGQTTFSTGCDHADWLTCGAVLEGAPGPIQVIIPMTDGTIIDNWQTYALRGTGSKIVDMEDVFVPEYRTVPNKDIAYAVAPGAKLHDNPIFRMPWHSMRPFSLTAVAVGTAWGAVEQFSDWMKVRVNRSGAKVADFQSLHLRIAESAAEYHAARHTMLADIREVLDLVRRDEEVSDEIRLRNKRDQAYCGSLASAAVDRLLYAAGANGLFSAADIQRKFRDVHAARAHQQINWDIFFSAYGRTQVGLDAGPVKF